MRGGYSKIWMVLGATVLIFVLLLKGFSSRTYLRFVLVEEHDNFD